MTIKLDGSFFVKIGFKINVSSGTEVCLLMKKWGSKIFRFFGGGGRVGRTKRKTQYMYKKKKLAISIGGFLWLLIIVDSL